MNTRLIYPFVLLMGILLLRGAPCTAEPAPSWKVTFTHKAGKSGVDMTSAANKQALVELDSIINRAQGRKLREIEVKSYSSPEGNLSWNTKLTSLRSSNIKKILEEKLDGMNYPQILENNVAEDWDAARSYLRQVDKPWKEEALKIIDSGDASAKKKLEDLWAGEAWDDLIWNCFYAVRRTEVIFSFDTASEIEETPKATGDLQYSIKFPVGRTNIVGAYLDNAGQLGDIKSAVNNKDPDKTIILEAFSSPEGKSSWNQVLARRRAEAVKAYLVSKGVSADKVKIVAIQEDWSGLKDAVKDNWFGEEKQDILRIIDDQTMDNDRRESELRKLSHGQVWNKLITSWMQDLRRVNVRLE